MNLARYSRLAKQFWHSLLPDYLFLLATGCLCVMALLYIQPNIYNGQVKLDTEQVWKEFTNPFKAKNDDQVTYDLRWQMHWVVIKPKQYLIIPDDCLLELTINDQVVNEIAYPMCEWGKGIVVTMDEYIQPGVNNFTAKVKNDGGPSGLAVRSVFFTGMSLAFHISLYVVVALFLWLVLRTKFNVWVRGTIIVGVLIRLFYFAITLPNVRAYDLDGHFFYIVQLAKNMLSLPALQDGWSTFHPPLYYYFGALFVRSLITESASSIEFVTRVLQVQSLAYSLMVFAISVYISTLVFTKQQNISRTVFLLLIASCFGVVMFAARINNDVLLLVVQTAFLAALLHYWQQPTAIRFYGVIALLCAAILTKTNALLLLPVAFGCLLFSRSALRQKVRTMFTSVLLILASTAWFFILRFTVENSDHLVGNIDDLNTELALQSYGFLLTEFNPIRMIQSPFVQIFSQAEPRAYFWEYWWRTMLFGEFHHGDDVQTIASLIVTCSLVLLVYGIRGVYATVKHNLYASLPMLLTLVCLLGGHVAFRIYSPFVTSQDFRYSALVLVPFAYFVTIGVRTSNQLFRNIAYLALIGFVVFQVWFLVQLAV